jgi:hypothetical protein
MPDLEDVPLENTILAVNHRYQVIDATTATGETLTVLLLEVTGSPATHNGPDRTVSMAIHVNDILPMIDNLSRARAHIMISNDLKGSE